MQMLRLTKAILAIRSASTIWGKSMEVPNKCKIIMNNISNFKITNTKERKNENAVKLWRLCFWVDIIHAK